MVMSTSGYTWHTQGILNKGALLWLKQKIVSSRRCIVPAYTKIVKGKKIKVGSVLPSSVIP